MKPREVAGVLVATVSALSACKDDGMVARLLGKQAPVEVPALISTELPFRYPPGLYIEGVQDDVTLRLFIDSLGRVVPESTRVAEPSKHALFDSAAVEGASKLSFRPAHRGERRIPYAVLFPVRFRMPSTAAPDTSRIGDSARATPKP